MTQESTFRDINFGEMNAEQLWDTTLNPEYRTLVKSIENAIAADHVFSMLMGDEFRQEEHLSRRTLNMQTSTPKVVWITGQVYRGLASRYML